MFKQAIFFSVLIFFFLYHLLAPTNSIPYRSDLYQGTQYWLLLHRISNKEFLYKGTPGDVIQSTLIKKFSVKTGIPNQRPTPLPQLLHKHYWTIIDAQETDESIETAPYFLTLDIPYTAYPPYGPVPYQECNGQCNWILPGAFGLHGIANDILKLSPENPGSSGCIRHTNEDITFLFKIVKTSPYNIRYYIQNI